MRPQLALVTVVFSFLRLVDGAIYQGIIDNDRDLRTGSLVRYEPATGVWTGSNDGCARCWNQWDVTKLFGESWAEATYRPGNEPLRIRLQWEGNSINVFFVLSNRIVPNVITQTRCEFKLDTSAPIPFTFEPSTSVPTQDLYNRRVFARQNMTHGIHNLEIIVQGDVASWIMFDYATYDYDDTLLNPSNSRPATSAPSTFSTSEPRPQPTTTTSTPYPVEPPPYTGPSSSGTTTPALVTSLPSIANPTTVTTLVSLIGQPKPSGDDTTATEAPPSGDDSSDNDGSSDGSSPSSDEDEDKKGPPVGLIVGAAGGALGVVILFVALLLILRRSQRRKIFPDEYPLWDPKADSLKPRPFTLSTSTADTTSPTTTYDDPNSGYYIRPWRSDVKTAIPLTLVTGQQPQSGTNSSPVVSPVSPAQASEKSYYIPYGPPPAVYSPVEPPRRFRVANGSAHGSSLSLSPAQIRERMTLMEQHISVLEQRRRSLEKGLAEVDPPPEYAQ